MNISLMIRTSGRKIKVRLESWQVDVVSDALGININDDLSISMFSETEINNQDKVDGYFNALGFSVAERLQSVNNIIASLDNLRRKLEDESHAFQQVANGNTPSTSKNVSENDYQPEL